MIIFCAFLHPKRYFRVWRILVTKILGGENRFFWTFEKCFPITFYPWIWPGNVFCRLWGRVFDNFQVAMVVLWPHAKIWNFQKMRLLRFFDAGRFGLKRHQNVLKNEIFQRYVLWTPKMFPDTLDGMIWSFEDENPLHQQNAILPLFESFHMTPCGKSHGGHMKRLEQW